MPKEKFHNDTIYSLTARLVQVYNPDAFNFLIKRKNKTEKINYIGNYSAFTCFDTYEIFDSLTDLNIIKNKIVLMGYMHYFYLMPVLPGLFLPDQERCLKL